MGNTYLKFKIQEKIESLKLFDKNDEINKGFRKNFDPNIYMQLKNRVEELDRRILKTERLVIKGFNQYEIPEEETKIYLKILKIISER